MADRVQRVNIAFQGGGARGIVHVGALRALEKISFPSYDSAEDIYRPEISSVAGTSAGAIMAALVAARYDASQIIADGNGAKDNLLRRIKRKRISSLTSLFTSWGWIKIRLISLLLSILPLVARIAFFVAVLAVVVVLGAWCYGYEFEEVSLSISSSLPVISIYLAGLFVLVAILALAFSRLVLRGLAPLDVVWDVIDEAIASAKLPGSLEGKKGVTFRQLEQAGGRSLRIVATDVTSKGLRIFSREETPDIAIADAVCASICLPLIFNPYEIDIGGVRHRFVDGGFLSNLPLWSFDNERAVDESCWTIGFSLESESKDTANSLAGLGSAILDSVVSGPPQIHARGISSLMVIPLRTTLKLLHFHKSIDDFQSEIRCAEDQATSGMQRAVLGPAVSMRIERLRTTLERELERLGASKGSVSLKIALACQRYAGSRFFPRFLAGYDDADKEFRTSSFIPVPSISDPFVYHGKTPNVPFLASSLWGGVVPVSETVDGFSVEALLLVESDSLTVYQICAIYGVGSIDELQPHLFKTVNDCLVAVDDDRELIGLIKDAQLWK
ncbi:TPA: patatin-like phospholipase family protein [Stenotrophomonas maltophilia]